ncbi:uncharacterized protein LOC107817303 isoform X2 [Nicotiana tabacum]|uniref:Uncharacterized protein LOC107817303 isoform X2 n=1 Tax=Nicotiana tabacum TaxID=4097 RepID=A0A1S4CBU6_TOBAC|nr:PREDICTED: uncharacterized protein LOC107817303 isoform X2 [Nicotiana tabacum]
MANSSRRLRSAFERSISPTGRFCNTMAATDATSFASYRTSSFYSSQSSGCFNRSASPTRVNLHALAPMNSTPSVKFSIDRSSSPRRSVAVSQRDQVVRKLIPKRTCLCSPTTHPGSFSFCISRRVRRSSFHYALAFPVRSPYLRSGVRRALASVHHLSSKVWVSYSGWLEARWHFEGR